MSKPYMLITPEPQLKLETQLGDYNLGHGLSIRPLEPKLRRRLLDIAKEKQCSEDCLLLFGWAPAPLFSYCWFLVAGTPDDMDLDICEMLDPKWEYLDQFTNIDWRSGQNEAVDISEEMKDLQRHWDKLSLLCQVNELNDIFIDRNVEEECRRYANEYVVGKIEELMKAKHGPDAVIPDKAGSTNVKTGDNVTGLPILPTASDEKQRAWLLVGLSRAYRNELERLSHELNVRVLDKRLDRAFQFFTDAFGMTQPHRFIAFATCLESLFCTDSIEIAFQLASRIAWFIGSDDYDKRAAIFAMAKRLYGLRSKIVHGVKYNSTQIDDSADQLEVLVRMAFAKIIIDDDMFRKFRDEDQKACKKYLEELNLGKPVDGTRS